MNKPISFYVLCFEPKKSKAIFRVSQSREGCFSLENMNSAGLDQNWTSLFFNEPVCGVNSHLCFYKKQEVVKTGRGRRKVKSMQRSEIKTSLVVGLFEKYRDASKAFEKPLCELLPYDGRFVDNTKAVVEMISNLESFTIDSFVIQSVTAH